MELLTCVPTLQRMSLLKVVTLLWNEETVHKQLSSVRKKPQWTEIKKRIAENIGKLEIPSFCKERIAGLVEAIGSEIISWYEYHIDAEDCPLKMPHQFNWTPEGTIDVRRTTESLVSREDIDILYRYFWACYYSLEHEIPTFWNKIDKTDSKRLANLLAFDFIVSFWTYKMDENLTWLPTELRNEYEAYFLHGKSHISVLFDFYYSHLRHIFHWYDSRKGVKWRQDRHRYSAAGDYFWQKLTLQEKRRFFDYFSMYMFGFSMIRENNNAACFLFLQMDEDRQNTMLRESKGLVLLSFLHWPKHTLFLDFAKRSWDFIGFDEFLSLTGVILKQARKGIEGFAGLFEAFWSQSRDNFKNFAYHHFTVDFFEDFCALADKRLILSILDSPMNVGFKNFFKKFVESRTHFEFSLETPLTETEQLQNALLVLDNFLKEESSGSSNERFKGRCVLQ